MWPEPDNLQETGLPRPSRTPGGNAAYHNFHNDFSHIRDPNLQRRLVLAEIGTVPFGWYHMRAVATAIKAATSAGAIVGQIIFGWLADRIGRKKMYGVELIILIVATLGQTISSPSLGVSISGLLIFGSVIMGLGIGGDHPMSAIITSDVRGAMMAAVFSMQGAGQFGAALVALLTTIGFRGSFSTASSVSTCRDACQLAANHSWRIIIGAGAFPAIFALYYRITVPETPRFTFDVARDIEKADADIKAYIGGKPDGHRNGLLREQTNIFSNPTFNQPRSSWSDFYAYFTQWHNGSVLLATMASWFFVDFAFYGLGVNNSTILAVIGYSSGSSVYEILYHTAVGNLILVCAGALPGYWLSIFTVDIVGRKPLQIGGFIILTILFCVIGFGYNSLNHHALLRSTGHGLSAASGKLGATIAQIIAVPLLLAKGAPAGCKGSDCSPWLDHLMEIFALFMLCGLAVSFVVPGTKRKTLEVLVGEAPKDGKRRAQMHGVSAGRGDSSDQFKQIGTIPRLYLAKVVGACIAIARMGMT
ncbi:hypothetical protein OIDMADRAFT_45054 [Oidiodendron maius Zn]|uniref:Major facilitator superfamily (MFS) profile domain-containing protein n=1 Tax=Oidiodendron maius (strain Zn) TaxID=913774 RepID=A0A0C3GWW8_OIDMZ|nr:hypothetical protein OIDMADRAFT_45054 [Oidiodendron maius Zn]